MKEEFKIIVAVDEKNGIGKNGVLPWSLSGDMKHFKDITCKVSAPGKYNIVVMGRRTWESIPEKYRPLPERKNIVLTRSKDFEASSEDVLIANSLERALEISDKLQKEGKAEDVFIIGGQQIFSEAIKDPRCKTLYVTHIRFDFNCDTFFPEFSDKFSEKSRSEQYSEDNVVYFFSEYKKTSY